MSGGEEPVQVRHSLVLRVGWLPLFLIGLSSGAGLVTTASDGFPGLGADAVVVVPLGVAVTLALTLGAIGVWRFRQLVSTTELVSRGLVRTRTVTAASAESISVVAGINRGLRRGPQLGGFLVRDSATSTGVVVSSTDRHFTEASRRLSAWVRLRPELVAHDATARDLLAGSGALAEGHADG